MKLATNITELCTSYVRKFPIKVGDFLDHVNFIVAPLQEHNIVLSMDWLCVNNVFRQCAKPFSQIKTKMFVKPYMK